MIPQGTRLGRYEIRSQLGAGGMGEVYLAQDTRLERTVALKILPAAVSSDQTRMHRFTQEAKAASALNHPNIITIHEIEQVDSTHFIATEFIDGETLRQHMAGALLSVLEALDIAIQTASALASAHEAGIIHRDIKPENIMRRRDGIVKVLDFGLAKLTERQSLAVDTEAATRALVNTAPGMVMGTATYMSPEQARGQQVDARTDIWSLGVLLYEMLAGRVPFEGETATDVIAAIVKSEPQPLTRHAPETPAKLEEIVAKALEKDREERYQTVKDLLVDLRRLKKRLDFEAELERSHPPDAKHGSAAPLSLEAHQEAAASSASAQATAHTDTIQAARPTTSAEYLVKEIKRHRTGLVLGLVMFSLLALAVVAGVIGLSLYRLRHRDAAAGDSNRPSAQMKITRVTSGNRIGGVSISADGKYVVYAIFATEQASLWVRQVLTNSTVQIVAPAVVDYRGTTFSPDGEFIYYVANDKNNPLGALFQVPVLGGAPRKLLTQINSPISFSPDGKRFAFTRTLPGQAIDALMIANLDGSGEQTLTVRKGNDWFSSSGPAWSPDGKVIACAAGTDTGGSFMTVLGIPVDGGAQKQLTEHKWLGAVYRVVWLTDGSGLILTAAVDQAQSLTQIWHLAYPGGEVRKITNDLNGYGTFSLGLTRDSNTIVTIQEELSAKMWRAAPVKDESQVRQLTSGKFDGPGGIAWTPDGRIIYVSKVGENADIWIMNGDGTSPRQLSSDAYVKFSPTVSPDGRYIFFTTNRAGDLVHIWRMDADGGNLKQLTEGTAADFEPDCSPDGQWVLFTSWRSGNIALWKVSIEGGAPVQLTDKPSQAATFSPDGKQIAYHYFDEATNQWRAAISSAEGGPPTKSFDLPRTVDNQSRLWWTPDGRSLLYVDKRNSVSNIWSMPATGAEPTQLTDFKSEEIYYFALSKDGRGLALARGTATSDLVLIRDFR